VLGVGDIVSAGIDHRRLTPRSGGACFCPVQGADQATGVAVFCYGDPGAAGPVWAVYVPESADVHDVEYEQETEDWKRERSITDVPTENSPSSRGCLAVRLIFCYFEGCPTSMGLTSDRLAQLQNERIPLPVAVRH
jgi:hypothetical protein